MSYLQRGDEDKKIANTNLNQKSSRSHTIFQIYITLKEQVPDQPGHYSIKTSQINLVDLAGSERMDKTHSDGLRMEEGKNINKSLFELSNVINKMTQKSQGSANKN